MSFQYQNSPEPSVPLNGHCSVIYNSNGVDTLYTFQANAFQSLPLQTNATWSTLAPGVSVNGAKCVLGQWNHQDALIVVGGTPTDSSNTQYPGLQYYTFGTKQWASIPPGNTVVQNRQMHGAAFLPATNTLLVYSGFQDNSFRSTSETFTIVAEPPYVSSSHPAGAPLAMNPIVIPWNASHAAMMGGSADNRAVWLFSSAQGWSQLGVSVPTIVSNLSAVSAATLNTPDDGKILELFDLTAVPNTVTSLDIHSVDSNPTPRSIGTRDVSPAYNGSLASTVERVGYSLAQSPSSGIVVASGGAGNAASAVIMFNQTANSWISPQAFFLGNANGGNNQLQSPLASSATSSVASSTATGTASTTPASLSATTSPTSIGSALPTSTAAPSGGLSDTNRTILGGVLGGLAGFGALLILLLLFFRSRRQKKRDRNRDLGEDKSRLEFDDSAAVANYPRAGSGASKRSAKDEWKRMPTAEEKLGAAISKPNFVSHSLSPIGGDGSTSQTQPLIGATGSPSKPKNDDGWNKYFAKGSKDITSEDRLRMDSVSHQTEYTASNYDIASHTASIYHDQETALLDPRSKLHTRGPSSEYRPESRLSDQVETFLDPASSTSGTQAWESLGAGDGQSSFDMRPASSVYAESVNYPHPGNKVHIAGEEQSFESSGATKGSSTNANSWRTDTRGMRTMAGKDLTGALSTRQQKDDMSWLNLGK